MCTTHLMERNPSKRVENKERHGEELIHCCFGKVMSLMTVVLGGKLLITKV